ncbi:hypothetical protein PBY51_005980 [Eleginops maclovinus]|uniref:Uncharacterized protein n=1 Tax=Eleginops maclovinus TaxID=56733 RepID=A0AAN7WDW9_ELEMC|nr:hypothetical protein PBY51_005980 [Eleginops maclovinus]
MGRPAGAWSGMRKHHRTTVYTWGGGGEGVSHAERDLKDKETMKCEHGRDVFEVTPYPHQLPLPPPLNHSPTSLTSSFPLSHLAGSTKLSWPRGLWRVQ